MGKVEFNEYPYQIKRRVIRAFDSQQLVGSLDYLPPSNPTKPVDLGLLNVRSSHQGLGIARALISRFADNIGHGILVKAIVTHEGTLDYLKRINPNPDSTKKSTKRITLPEEIDKIPIVGVVESGDRIKVTQVNVTYNPRSDLQRTIFGIYQVTIQGITR